MEFLTILFSSLLGILAPVGVVTDRVAENAIRDRLESAEVLEVRIDNAPSYQILQGEVERVRIAGRGVYPVPDARIEVLEIETDAVSVDLNSVRQGEFQLNQPFQAGVRLVLKPEDLNQFFASPAVSEQLRDLSVNLIGGLGGQTLQRYDFVDPQVEFLGNNRVRFSVSLQERNTNRRLAIASETDVEVLSGQQLQLTDLSVSANGERVPPEITNVLAAGINQRLNLNSLEEAGITARVLKLDIGASEMSLAAFIRLEPSFAIPESSGN